MADEKIPNDPERPDPPQRELKDARRFDARDSAGDFREARAHGDLRRERRISAAQEPSPSHGRMTDLRDDFFALANVTTGQDIRRQGGLAPPSNFSDRTASGGGVSYAMSASHRRGN